MNKADITHAWNSLSGANHWTFADFAMFVHLSTYSDGSMSLGNCKLFIMVYWTNGSNAFIGDSLYFTHLSTNQSIQNNTKHTVDIQPICSVRTSFLMSQTSYRFVSMTLREFIYYQFCVMHHKCEWHMIPAFKEFIV